LQKPIDLVDEDARAEPDPDVPRGVEESEDREGDAAEQRREAFDATQQQIHHAREQRNEPQGPDVDDQPGGDLVPDDGIELVTLAGRMERSSTAQAAGTATINATSVRLN
jgi:hypothetical protein